MSTSTLPLRPAAARPWGRAVLWLVLLAPFFFASYGLATWVTTQRARVGSLVFGWERHIPFLPWTILPYWSIDLLYGISLFICTNRPELDRHARRLLTAQLVAVTCFLLFPLQFTFARPVPEGLSGALFAVLASFDKPFNQAPSLHIALLVILWDLYARHIPPRLIWLLHVWLALIGLSVLTTYQHHFVDVPTGALLGVFCLWLWPESGPSPAAQFRWTPDRRRWRLASRYAIGALACAVLAAGLGGFGLWLFWPAVSLAMVALNYAAVGPSGFQKRENGRLTLGAGCLLAPYLVGAWLNTKLWPGDGRRYAELGDRVWIGRIPWGDSPCPAVVDLCAELPGGRAANYTTIPLLDLVRPAPATLRQAADAIERARQDGPVLVCCALGYSRSAAAAATWLLASGRAATVDAAIDKVRRVRPHLVLNADAAAAIAAAAAMA